MLLYCEQKLHAHLHKNCSRWSELTVLNFQRSPLDGSLYEHILLHLKKSWLEKNSMIYLIWFKRTCIGRYFTALLMCIFALFLSIDMTSFRHIFVLELGFKQIHNPEALLAQFSASMLTNDKTKHYYIPLWWSLPVKTVWTLLIRLWWKWKWT